MKWRKSFHDQNRENGEESVWISLSDLMTALLAVFMLASVILVFSLAQEQEALAVAKEEIKESEERSERFDAMLAGLGSAEQRRHAMVEQIEQELASHGIAVEVDATKSVIRVPVDLLGFKSGSSDIESKYEEHAILIGEIIGAKLLEDQRHLLLDTVFIEGHTDDVPMTSLSGGNWSLSAHRAISLWRLWERSVSTDLASLTGYYDEPLFSVSGYADSRPVNTTDSDTARAENRRIDIRFTEHRLSEEEIRAIQAGGR